MNLKKKWHYLKILVRQKWNLFKGYKSILFKHTLFGTIFWRIIRFVDIWIFQYFLRLNICILHAFFPHLQSLYRDSFKDTWQLHPKFKTIILRTIFKHIIIRNTKLCKRWGINTSNIINHYWTPGMNRLLLSKYIERIKVCNLKHEHGDVVGVGYLFKCTFKRVDEKGEWR